MPRVKLPKDRPFAVKEYAKTKICAQCGKRRRIFHFGTIKNDLRRKIYRCCYCYDCVLVRNKAAKERKFHKKHPIDIIAGEIWLPVPGYEELYSVSNYCRIMTESKTDSSGKKRKRRLMKPTLSVYYKVMLYKGGKSIVKNIHILAAKAFIPNPENKPEVNHKDGNKLNNHISNLEWVTGSENSQHAIRTGLFKQIGDKGYFAKLTNAQAIEIYTSILPLPDLSKKYNVCEATIRQIKSGFRWKQVTGAKHYKKRRVLSLLEIKGILSSNEVQWKIAKKYNIEQTTVSRIKRNPEIYEKIATKYLG